MNREMSSASSSGFKLRTKMVFLSASAFLGILLVTVISMILMSEIRIGGKAYKTISNDKDALENIALLKSDLYQTSYDVQRFMLEADKAAADQVAAAIKNRAIEIDKKFEIGLRLSGTGARQDAINKASTIWVEYKKTLLDDVLPAASHGDIYGASNLMSGIQA